MQVYYINLATREDRRAQMEQQFTRLGISAHRVEAVRPRNLPNAHRYLYIDSGSRRAVTETELSCSLSHHRALRAFLQTDDTHALILEDDAVLSDALPELLAMPINCDVLRVETFGSPQTLSSVPQWAFGRYQVFDIYGWCWGAAAYVVSRQAAETILRDGDALASPYDRVIFNRKSKARRSLRIGQLVPALAIQEQRQNRTDTYSGDIFGIVSSTPRPWYHRFADWVEYEIWMALPKTIRRLSGKAEKVSIPFLRPD